MDARVKHGHDAVGAAALTPSPPPRPQRRVILLRDCVRADTRRRGDDR